MGKSAKYRQVLFLGIVILSFLLGSSLVWKMKAYFREQAGIISEYYFKQIPYRNYQEVKILCYLLGKRLKWAVILSCAAYVQIRDFCASCMAGWLGFSGGYLSAIAIVKFGGRGLGALVLAAMPQGIFYLWGMVKLYKSNGFQTTAQAILILVVGIFSECYLNQAILKWLGMMISLK